MISARKIGAPMSDVITPTGITAETSIALETMSHPSRNAPPTAMAPGMTKRLSDPTTSLTMCGTISPTNPMIPAKLMMDAAMNESTIRQTMRILSLSRPRDFASLSSRDIRFSLLDRTISTAIPTTHDTSTNGMASQDRSERFPTCHL